MGKEVNGAARVQLTSAGNVQPCWQDVGGILVAVGAIGVSGRIVIVDREGNFAAAVGVQTFANDIEVAATPLQPGTNLAGSGLPAWG